MPNFRNQNEMEIEFDAQIDDELIEASMQSAGRAADKLGEKLEQALGPKNKKAAKEGALAGTDLVKQGTAETSAEVERLGKTWQQTQRQQLRFGSAGMAAIEALMSKVTAAKLAVVGLAAGVVSSITLVQQASATSRSEAGLLNLGVDQKRLAAINAALNNTVDKVTLMGQVREAIISGNDVQQLEQLAKAAAVLAKQTGLSKQEAFQMLTTGELQEGLLQKLGLSQKQITNEILKAKLAMGGVGSELDAVTERNIRNRVIIDQLRKLSGDWKSNTKQVGDNSAQILARLKDSASALGQRLLPYANKLVNLFGKTLDKLEGMQKWIDQIGNSKSFKEFSKAMGEIATFAKNSVGYLKELKAEIDRTFKIDSIKAFSGFFERFVKSLPYVQTGVTAMKGLRMTIQQANKDAKTLLANKPQPKSIFDLDVWKQLGKVSGRINNELARHQKERLNRMKRIREERIRQAREARLALQGEAREMIRTFDQNFTDLLSNLGGSFSGVISAMKEIPEKFRVLGSLPHLREGISKTIGLSLKQIDAQKKQLGLSDEQVKAAKLFNLALQAGKLDIEEYIGNEKAVNAQLKAGLSTLQAQSKIASVLVEKNNLAKDVAASKLTVELMQNQLLSKQKQLREAIEKNLFKGNQSAVKGLLTQDQVLRSQLKTLSDARARYKAISKERKRLLDLQMAGAKIELRGEVASKFLTIEKERNALVQKRLAIMNELSAAAGTTSQYDLINQRAAARIREAELSVKSLGIQLATLQDRLKQGLVPTGEIAITKANIALIKQKIAAQQDYIDKVNQIRDVQARNITLVGQLEQKALERLRNDVAEKANMFTSMGQEVMGSVGGIITNFFSDLATNQENALQTAGSAFLQVLAGMAAKLAAFYITTGTAQLFVPPYTGGGAIAAGVALAALASGLGVASSVVAPSASNSSSAAASSSARTSFQSSLPGVQRPDSRRPENKYYLVNGAPWLGSNGQVARRWAGWMETEGRKQKGRNVRIFGG